MSRYNLARLGGLAATLGGALSATVNALNFVLILSVGPSKPSRVDPFSHSWSS